ncbi:NADH-quinone oxidoreductase subunit D [Dehalobacterium formicoaceticum]|uniref:NADH-quinone oxidoreductase subunit D n=1 Tax=Dehalobacterium formicoaceticum TaxID=51515 RepID=A0ABT1Y5T7_9FIRM|nr:NADH-quinone oxidoreductase subunit D [Dehalobacterium formicoaceticum]MCR6546238.1 NADH-quinone oxidoreductase subunit D [Dehalobacterium formicoaceticum]
MVLANQEGNFRTQEFILNMGPQHPSTHGVYRAVLTMDGEYVVDAENVVGYLHRGMEKIAESRTYTQFIPYTDRMDYLAAMLNNWGYVLTLEEALNLEIPERAEYIRVIVGELQRIASHLVMVASFGLDMNAYTAWMYAFYDREKILDLFEMICGSRLTTSFMRVGGVPNDIPEGFLPKLEEFLQRMPKRIKEFDDVLTGNEIFLARTKNVAPISGEEALDYGLTGPNLRASGVNFDLRKVKPYSIYDRFEFDVALGENGDNFDRYNVRMEEIRQSLRIIRQAIDQLPEGDIMAKVPKVLKIPAGETYGHIEGAKGILGFYLVSDGGTKPYRMHLRSPSFINLGIFPKMARGTILQDAIASLASIDIVLGEVDR